MSTVSLVGRAIDLTVNGKPYSKRLSASIQEIRAILKAVRARDPGAPSLPRSTSDHNLQAPICRIGALICGENTNPLSRFALMAEGEQVHISTYPTLWPTRPPAQSGAYNLQRAIEIRAGAHSFEAKVFNVVSSGFADKLLKDMIAFNDKEVRDIIRKVSIQYIDGS